MALIQARPAPFLLDAAFQEQSPGDCILRAAGGVRFKVFRAVLILASPVFNDLFGIPQPFETSDPLPVIDVSETPAVLQTALRIIYPQKPPTIDSYDHAVHVVAFFDKYCIDILRLKPFFHEILLSDDALEKDPLAVYGLAWRMGLEDAAKKASRYTHKLDLSDWKLKRDLVRWSGNVQSLLALWEMRQKREVALVAIIKFSDGLLARYCSSHQDNFPGQLHRGTAATLALQAPFPTCENIDAFFGFHIPRYTATYSICRCKEIRETRPSRDTIEGLEGELRRYPQTIDRISQL